MATMQVSEVVAQPWPASLYIGDLDPRVTTADLFHAFSGADGKVTAIRVCTDAITGLRYGYVNFGTAQDAAKAMSSLNHTVLKGKAMRIMWCERNPVTRMTGVANLFIKNLDPSIDSAQLEAIFEKFGTIRSCKVAEENGKSKGFGFVQFEKENSAMAALNAMHDTVLSSKKLYVAQFMRKSQRIAASEQKFTNLYVKNLDEDLSEDRLLKKFSVFGTVHNVVVMRDRDGKSKGFGFVSFEYPEEARKAVEALNGTLIGSKQLYVGRAQKKAERKELSQRARAANVYIKNVDPAVNEEMLAAHFSSCGEVISKKIMRHENGLSKGFGFLSFSSPEEAKRAVQALSGSTLLGRRLYVGIAQSKEDCKRALQERVSRPAPSIQGASGTRATPSAPWSIPYPRASGASQVRISRPRASAEKPQVDRVHPKAQIQEILPEEELKRLITSPNGLAELIEKLLIAKGGNFTTGDHVATPLPVMSSQRVNLSH
ncbi:hypothetical protein Droror1_Dr00006460 [Drosera rotundifolia]